MPSGTPWPKYWAPFGFIDFATRTKPRVVTLMSIADGTSNTLMLSEQIMGPDDSEDWRGDFLNDDQQTGKFNTIDPPNTGVDWFRTGYAPSCVNTLQLPCMLTSAAQGGKISARSRHTGGESQQPGGSNRVVLRVADLPAQIDALKKADVKFRNQMEAGPVGRQIQVEDPDGNPIELFESAR